MRKLLDAAAAEFGEKGFHEASISSITHRAGTALGSFYTYFNSKEALFQALVQDMSARVRDGAANGVARLKNEKETAGEKLTTFDVEEAAFAAFLRFVKEHKEIYRIIDEAEFVDPASYRTHYQSTAARILERLQAGSARGDLRDDISEIHAWALMGMNVFLGLRFAVWDDSKSPEEIARTANEILHHGILRQKP